MRVATGNQGFAAWVATGKLLLFGEARQLMLLLLC